MKRPLIIWVDDEEELLRPYTIFLRDKGYEVITLNNGNDAIDRAREELPDIIFLDEMMPGMSGLETLQELKHYLPEVPVVMITKSEEENIMDLAIGEKIADYLIKPVNPNQILLCLKKHLHRREIVEQHASTNYREAFQDIAYMINSARTLDEFMAIHRTLVRWELELEASDPTMLEMLHMQRRDAEQMFARFVKQHYQELINSAERPLFSPDVMKRRVLPLLDNGEKVCLMVFDNFRYDQFKTLQPLISELFNIVDDGMYTSILPTATQYARNAIFSGLMPLQIQQMFPDLWVDEEEEEGKNQNEEELIGTLMQRYRKNYRYRYHKINESEFGERVIRRLQQKSEQGYDLEVIVVNFIDMLSHSRTESKMMRELAADEAAYRSLTLSWFRHSSTYELMRQIARMGYTLILTTDHGTVRVNNAVNIIGDRNTNTNLRYKVGKSLNCKSKDVFVVTDPQQIGLPTPNVSSSYIFCTGNDFFAYPNNYNYYVSYYRDTFQHGGISMDEMLIPLITLHPKES